MLFERRTEQPSKDNKYYLHTPKGYNKCIKITGDECIPNCVGYAYGRWMEAQKIKKCDLPTSNAENWYHDYNGKKGKIVKLGSVIVWKKGKIHFSKDGSGHVAYVECVYPDGSIDTTESAYGGKRWYTKHYNKKYRKTGYQFEGFIYPDVEFEDHPFVEGWYKTLNYKYIRRTPEVASGNKMLLKDCSDTIKAICEKGKYAKTDTQMNIYLTEFKKDKKGNIWGRLRDNSKKSYICVYDKTGNQVMKV